MFPKITASNLNKEKVSFPDGLAGERNLVLVAFQREQQSQVDTWLHALPGILKQHPGVAYYEVPVIDRVNPMVRFFIDTGMRGGIPDKAQRGRTVTFYTDKAPFKQALGIPTEEQIYVLLIDRSGKVLWRTEGPFAEAKRLSLVESLKTAPAPNPSSDSKRDEGSGVAVTFR